MKFYITISSIGLYMTPMVLEEFEGHGVISILHRYSALRHSIEYENATMPESQYIAWLNLGTGMPICKIRPIRQYPLDHLCCSHVRAIDMARHWLSCALAVSRGHGEALDLSKPTD